jgi:MFS family permease
MAAGSGYSLPASQRQKGSPPAMRGTVVSVFSLLAGISLFMLGNGLLGSLLSVRLAQANVPTLTAGMVMAAYFAGLALGSATANRLIASVGHIRAFTALASGYSAAALLHPLAPTAAFWGGLRFVEGFCVAGVFMCTESWLNERASNQIRGRIMSLYMIMLYLALGAGQFLLDADTPNGFGLFAIASAIASVALIPVALTRMPAPAAPAASHLGLTALYRLSPLGVFGSFASGVILGSFYALGPAYAHYVGLDLGETARFMAAVIFGGLLLQWPIGAFSDRFDRRIVMLALNAAVALACLGIVLFAGTSFTGLIASAFIFGALTFVLYPLAVAHANDFADDSDFVAVAGGMILAYGIGSAIGPVAAAALMTTIGPSGLFAFAAITALVALVFTLWRMRRGPTLPETRTPFVAMPRTTPASNELDPRAPVPPPMEPAAEPPGAVP